MKLTENMDALMDGLVIVSIAVVMLSNLLRALIS